MGIAGGQIGFDEGGVLQSLSDPIWTHKVTKFKRNAKGHVIKQIEDEGHLRPAHILGSAAFIGAYLYIKHIGLDDFATLALLGPVLGTLVNVFRKKVEKSPESLSGIERLAMVLAKTSKPEADIPVPGLQDLVPPLIDVVVDAADPFDILPPAQIIIEQAKKDAAKMAEALKAALDPLGLFARTRGTQR